VVVTKILLISTTALQYDGITKVVLSMCKCSESLKIKSSVLTGQKTTAVFQNYLEKNQVEHYYFFDRTKNTIRYFWNLCRLLKKEKYDVVHVHGNSATMAIEIFAAWLCGVRIRIAHVHNNATNYPVIHALLRNWLIMLATERIACSHQAGAWLYKDNYSVVPNGIELEKYRFDRELQIQIKRELGCTNKKIIGHIGRFSSAKNHEFLIRVFHCICQLCKDVILLLVGEGELFDEIKNMVHCCQLDDRVIFYGTSDNVPALLSAMDIFVMPSRWEAFGIAGIEAQASGLQCFFSTAISREIVVSNNCHFLSLDDSYQIWADNILYVLEHDDGRAIDLEQMRQKGYDAQDLENRLKQIWHLNKLPPEGDV